MIIVNLTEKPRAGYISWTFTSLANRYALKCPCLIISGYILHHYLARRLVVGNTTLFIPYQATTTTAWYTLHSIYRHIYELACLTIHTTHWVNTKINLIMLWYEILEGQGGGRRKIHTENRVLHNANTWHQHSCAAPLLNDLMLLRVNLLEFFFSCLTQVNTFCSILLAFCWYR